MNKQRTTKAMKSSVVSGAVKRRATNGRAHQASVVSVLAPERAPERAPESRQAEVARKVGARMRDLRLEQKMSLVQLQQRGGLTPSQMSSIERGHVQMTLGTVVSVAAALQLPTFMVLLLPDEDPLSAVIEEIRQAYGGDWGRASVVIANALGIDLSKLMAR
jgi:transcriptional regulator with XRE-family HTH domain